MISVEVGRGGGAADKREASHARKTRRAKIVSTRRKETWIAPRIRVRGFLKFICTDTAAYRTGKSHRLRAFANVLSCAAAEEKEHQQDGNRDADEPKKDPANLSRCEVPVTRTWVCFHPRILRSGHASRKEALC